MTQIGSTGNYILVSGHIITQCGCCGGGGGGGGDCCFCVTNPTGWCTGLDGKFPNNRSDKTCCAIHYLDDLSGLLNCNSPGPCCCGTKVLVTSVLTYTRTDEFTGHGWRTDQFFCKEGWSESTETWTINEVDVYSLSITGSSPGFCNEDIVLISHDRYVTDDYHSHSWGTDYKCEPYDYEQNLSRPEENHDIGNIVYFPEEPCNRAGISLLDGTRTSAGHLVSASGVGNWIYLIYNNPACNNSLSSIDNYVDGSYTGIRSVADNWAIDGGCLGGSVALVSSYSDHRQYNTSHEFGVQTYDYNWQYGFTSTITVLENTAPGCCS